MNKKDFEGLKQGLSEAVAHARGDDVPGIRVHAPAEVDVRAIRQRFRLSQAQFADRYGFTVGAVRDWEQKRRTPGKAARILLRVIEHEPEAIDRAVRIAG